MHTVLNGRCWLSVAGDRTPTELQAGDCYLLPRGDAFVIASHPPHSGHDARDQVVARSADGITTYNGGGSCLVTGLFFDFESPLADLLFRSLPGVVIVRGRTNEASGLHLNIRRFAAEFHGSGVGRSLIMNQLAPIILLDILRTYLAREPDNAT